MIPSSHFHTRASRAVVFLALAVMCGCGTTRTGSKREPAFFPSPPAPPRIQYLTSFSSGKDLGMRPSWLRFLIGEDTEPDELSKPYGVCMRDDKIFVCDTIQRSIAVFDLAKRKLNCWCPRGDGRLQSPINIASDHDGTTYVADTTRGAVLVFDRTGKYRGCIGGNGMKPAGVALSKSRVYVADLAHHNVGVYDRQSLAQLFTIPRTGTAKGALFSPTNLALDSSNRLYVSDTGAFRIQQYDADGNYLRSFGAAGDAPGQFARPKGVAVDRDGRMYAVDAAMQAVQIFAPTGELLMYFGGPETGAPELSLPAGICIDYDHVARFKSFIAPGFSVEYLVLVSSQYGEHKVSVYGFGRQT